MLYTLHKNTSPGHAFQDSIDDLRQLIVKRLQAHFRQNGSSVPPLVVENGKDPLRSESFGTLLPFSPTFEERVVILLGLVPHINPAFFSSIITEQLPDGGDRVDILKSN